VGKPREMVVKIKGLISLINNPAQWLHELKAMTKDIAMSHHGADSLSGARKFNLQFDFFALM